MRRVSGASAWAIEAMHVMLYGTGNGLWKAYKLCCIHIMEQQREVMAKAIAAQAYLSDSRAQLSIA